MVEGEVRRLGLRGAAVLRAVVACCAVLLALLAAPTGNLALDAGVAMALGAWGLLARALVADAVLVGAACLTQRWLLPSEAWHDSTSWVVTVAAVAVAYWQWADRGGIPATVSVLVAYLAGSGGGSGAAVVALWLVVEAVLSRALFRLLVAGARAADRSTAEVERARRETAVAAARRADARAHLAALHDTAAATLLAIGTGTVTGREPWLAEQYAHDLDTLTGSTPRGTVDLTRLLDDVARRVPVGVTSSTAGEVLVPAVAAVAIGRSFREALVNVARHAGSATASVRVERAAGRVVVEVVDGGPGFDPERVPSHRRGIALSIVERMADAGGRATVRSAPGQGTRVRLEWPHG